MRFKPRQIVMIAILIAMAILFRRIFTLHFPIGVFTLAAFPIILAGFFFGPVAGGLVGAISDVLGFPFFPSGPYSPLFTLTAALTGVIPALSARLFTKEQLPLWVIALSVFFGQFITKIFLVPYFLSIQFGVPFLWKAVTNLFVELIHVPVYALLIHRVLMVYGEMSMKSYFTVEKYGSPGIRDRSAPLR